jgi:hypothetical protein
LRLKNKNVVILIILILISTSLTVIGTDIDDNNEYFVKGEIIIKIKYNCISSLTFNKIKEIFNVISIEKVFVNSENSILDNIYLLKLSGDSNILPIVEYYSSLPFIEYAEPNYIIQPPICIKSSNNHQNYDSISNLESIPNDPDFGKQWGLHNIGQEGGKEDSDIDAPEAWDIEKGDENIIIAIVDSGVDYTHPDLADNIWINEDEIPDNNIDDDDNGFIDDIMGWDFAYGDSNPIDDCGHGTHCAGIAGAVTNNNIGIAGVCWNCKIMNVKIGFENNTEAVLPAALGVQYAADNGSNVISMSWGDYTHYQVLEDAINYAYDKGAVLLAAVGNEEDDIPNDYPPAYENVIAVASTNNWDQRAIFSNYGSIIDIAAPGQNIYSTMPTYEVYFNTVMGFEMNYDYMNGNSMACPCVAGLAGLILSKNSSLSQEEVRSIICENVDPYDSGEYIGTGRINAYKALSAGNIPPDKPIITGDNSGKIRRDYEFNVQSFDSNSDDIFYYIDWGDEQVEEWIGPYSSGEEVIVEHRWNKQGNYIVKVKAKDVCGAESDWATLEISMPKIKSLNYFNPWISRFIERYPILKFLL